MSECALHAQVRILAVAFFLKEGRKESVDSVDSVVSVDAVDAVDACARSHRVVVIEVRMVL